MDKIMDTDRGTSTGGSGAARPFNVGVTFQHDLYDLGEAVMKSRAIQAFDNAAARFPIHRVLRCAARRELELVFDDLALNFGLAAQRLDTGTLLLDGPGVFVQADGWRHAGYCSCRFNVWAGSVDHVEQVRSTIFRIVGDDRVRDQLFVVDWRYADRRGHLCSSSFEELADDELLDEAYPMLGRPVRSFIEQYVNAPESVLILLGPAGTGKTRLVRAILAALSRRKGDSADVLYTADKVAVRSDELFVSFVTGTHDAFVIEDADYLLQPRTDGNTDVHRFLMVADGVVRAQSRKLLFTTNLPNVGAIDEALQRPGRCFATMPIRPLNALEVDRLAGRLSNGNEDLARRIAGRALLGGSRTATLATVYKAYNTEYPS
jgi:ATPase family associated with various cellular activities (AAA)